LAQFSVLALFCSHHPLTLHLIRHLLHFIMGCVGSKSTVSNPEKQQPTSATLPKEPENHAEKSKEVAPTYSVATAGILLRLPDDANAALDVVLASGEFPKALGEPSVCPGCAGITNPEVKIKVMLVFTGELICTFRIKRSERLNRVKEIISRMTNTPTAQLNLVLNTTKLDDSTTVSQIIGDDEAEEVSLGLVIQEIRPRVKTAFELEKERNERHRLEEVERRRLEEAREQERKIQRQSDELMRKAEFERQDWRRHMQIRAACDPLGAAFGLYPKCW